MYIIIRTVDFFWKDGGLRFLLPILPTPPTLINIIIRSGVNFGKKPKVSSERPNRGHQL